MKTKTVIDILLRIHRFHGNNYDTRGNLSLVFFVQKRLCATGGFLNKVSVFLSKVYKKVPWNSHMVDLQFGRECVYNVNVWAKIGKYQFLEEKST